MHVGCSDYFRLGHVYPRGALRERYFRRPRPWVQPGTLPPPEQFPVPCPYRPGPAEGCPPDRPERAEAPPCDTRPGAGKPGCTDTRPARPDTCC